jgi:hypothetical protein
MRRFKETPIVIGLNAVIVAVTDEVPRILTVKHSSDSSLAGEGPRQSFDALPYGPMDPAGDRTLELGLRRWVREHTRIEVGYVEQLYTFGDRHRDPHERRGGPRVISIAYLALVRERKLSGAGTALWKDWYRFLPWEDWREGRPGVIDQPIAPVLDAWVTAAPDAGIRRERRERCDIHFGLHGAPWVGERVLERYELLYEVGLAVEAKRDGIVEASDGAMKDAGFEKDAGGIPAIPGEPMAYDHRRILATALGRMRGKLKYRPVVFELLPPAFTLLQLQRVVEALAGRRLHKQNLRRLVEKGRLVEGTGTFDMRTGGRPAEIFRFRREVLRERPATGVG